MPIGFAQRDFEEPPDGGRVLEARRYREFEMLKSAVLSVLFVLVGVAAPVQAQGKSSQETPAAKAGQGDKAETLQQQAYNKYLSLKASMEALRKQLSDQDASKAERIKRGLRLMSESKLAEKMREVRDLLAEESFDQAISAMDKVQRRLNQLLMVLLDRDDDLSEILKKIDTLENFKKKVEELIEDQKKERDESAEAEALAKQLERIQKARAKLGKRSKKQGELKKQTASKGAGQKESKDLAETQKEVADEAKDLEGELRDIEEAGKELDAAAGKPGEGKPGEGKPGEGKPGEGKPGEASGSASKSVGKAAKSMGQSGQKLSQNQPESSLDDQEKALDELKEAEDKLAELEKEAQRKLLEIPFEKLKSAQLQTLKKTDKLAEDMEKADEGGEDGEPGFDGKLPGKNNVQQAVPKQKNAAGSLKEVKPGKAKQKQQDAVDDLEEAKKRLEDALAQLRQELQEQVLKALEERFTEMLSKQREITAGTILTQKKRKEIEALTAKGKVPSFVRERCQKFSEAESTLRADAESALKLIEEEGSSAVFPEIVKEIAEDLALVSGFLENFETGLATVEVQKQIENVLEELLDALTRRMEQQDGKDGQGNGEGQDQPLIPLTAELRMLRTLQVGVNRKTKVVNKLETGKKRKDFADNTAKKQGRVKELTRKLANKLLKEEGAGDKDGGK